MNHGVVPPCMSVFHYFLFFCHLLISLDVLSLLCSLSVPFYYFIPSLFSLLFSPSFSPFHPTPNLFILLLSTCPSQLWLCWINASVTWRSWSTGHLAQRHMVQLWGFIKFLKSLHCNKCLFIAGSLSSEANTSDLCTKLCSDILIPDLQVCIQACKSLIVGVRT